LAKAKSSDFAHDLRLFTYSLPYLGHLRNPSSSLKTFHPSNCLLFNSISLPFRCPMSRRLVHLLTANVIHPSVKLDNASFLYGISLIHYFRSFSIPITLTPGTNTSINLHLPPKSTALRLIAMWIPLWMTSMMQLQSTARYLSEIIYITAFEAMLFSGILP
jgi:hypothetical protein